MKRSKINHNLIEAVSFLSQMHFRLPPFAYWSPDKWTNCGHEYDEIRDNKLGWDVTDFGSGDYDQVGLLLFTIRNGNATDARYPKPYAEKLLIVQEGQVTPYHFHWHKMEDIINRGGGDLVMQLYNSTDDGGLADTSVHVSVDGQAVEVEAGGIIKLMPGESITLTKGLYHQFWAENRPVLAGEVSAVNDDSADNRFYEPRGRFPAIDEDEPALYLLCNEYPGSTERNKV